MHEMNNETITGRNNNHLSTGVPKTFTEELLNSFTVIGMNQT
jgi:hypothetical protein